MNNPWDTPPDGDFVRYLERITAPSPGAVTRSAAPAPEASVPAPVFTRAADRRSGAPQRPPGPPDLGTIFRGLARQLGDELKKAAERR